MRRTFLKTIPAALYGAATGFTVLSAPAARGAEPTWPTKPIRVIMPFAPGGGSDSVARIVTQALTDVLGQSVIVDNRPGAAGTLGVTVGLQAPADGYTFIWCTPAAQVISPSTIRYDPEKDFAPVSMVLSGAYMLVVNPQSPYQSVQDVIAAARAKPGSVNYGTAGAGTFGHLVAASFALAAKTEMVQIPFSGEAQAMMSVMSGEVPLAFISCGGALSHVKAGKARALGLSSATPMEGVPDDIPLISSTVPGFNLVAINYVSARAGTPAPVVDKMNQAIQTVMKMPAVRERILAMGVTPEYSTPQELGKRVSAERARLMEVVRSANIALG